MTNHIHFQLQTLQHSPSDMIKFLHFNYAKYFNGKYEYTDHVFKSRYASELITSREFELEVNRYIYLNPIRAEMVKSLEEYPSSSYFDYAETKKESLVNAE